MMDVLHSAEGESYEDDHIVILLLANAHFSFLVLYCACDHSSKHTHHLKQVCFPGVDLPY